MDEKSPRRSRGVMVLVAAEPQPFEEIFAIDDLRAAGQAFELTQAFQPAVTPEGRFDLATARSIAESTPDMSIAGELALTLEQDHDHVSIMVARVTEALASFLGIALPPMQQQQIEAAILFAFTNLNSQSKDAWIFYSSESAHSTTYQYNIMFAVQTEETRDAIFGVPMGLTIRVDREYERVLFITVKDEVSYKVDIAALKVLIPFEAARQDAARLFRRIA